MTTAIAADFRITAITDPEEAEWLALEATHERNPWTRRLYPKGHQGAPPVSSKPHPQSYGADLPLYDHGQSQTDLTRTTKADRAQLALRPIIVTQSPDADALATVLADESCRVRDVATKPWVRHAKADIKRHAQIVAGFARRRAMLRDRASELSLTIEVR